MQNVAKNHLKIVVICGPTATGKSDLAIRLAKKYDGEILCVDSRQVYKNLTIGSGKVIGTTEKKLLYRKPVITSEGIKHYGLDIANPSRNYPITSFQKYAQKILLHIARKNKLPIVCGGSGFWLNAVVNNPTLPSAPPNPILRSKLSKLSTSELFKKLQQQDPQRALHIDPKNPYRLIRALEIINATGKPVSPVLYKPLYNTLWIGLDFPTPKLIKKIHTRLISRIKDGMLTEIQHLIKQGVSSQRLENLGLEYRYGNRFINNELSKQDFLNVLESEIVKYAKRQRTWFKKNPHIRWIKQQNEAFLLTEDFLD